jgi:hypothetical protein
MLELGEPEHGEDEWTDLAKYGWMGPTTVKMDGRVGTHHSGHYLM